MTRRRPAGSAVGSEWKLHEAAFNDSENGSS